MFKNKTAKSLYLAVCPEMTRLWDRMVKYINDKNYAAKVRKLLRAKSDLTKYDLKIT